MLGLVFFVSVISLTQLKCRWSKNRDISDQDDFNSLIVNRKAADTDKRNRPKSILVVTRIHAAASSSFPSNQAVVDFIQRAVTARVTSCELQILILLGNDKSLSDLQNVYQQYNTAVESINLDVRVTIYPVFPWGYFTIPLNYALLFAQDKAADVIIFQVSVVLPFFLPYNYFHSCESFELSTNSATLSRMLHVLYSFNALVVGSLLEGHDFCVGFNQLRGRTTPWNTLAVWDVEKLSIFGFPLIGDGNKDRSFGGVEVRRLRSKLFYLTFVVGSFGYSPCAKSFTICFSHFGRSVSF
jgi:hypothetical protein